MNTTQYSSLIYYRLIALWVMGEVMLGGFLHAMHIPITGLVAGTVSVTCISLIAYYIHGRGQILKAVIIVAIFKMMLSPMAPPMAYFALFFQVFCGEIFFWRKNMYRISCLLLAVISMMESAMQRMIILTIVYGTNGWKALNIFISEFSGSKTLVNYSLYIAIIYLLVHLAAGLVVGWWIGTIPSRAGRWVFNDEEKNVAGPLLTAVVKKRSWGRKAIYITWIFLGIIYLQSFLPGKTWMPAQLPLQILLRSVLIILSWYFLFSPLISFLIKKWLAGKKENVGRDVNEVLLILPSMQQIVRSSWKAGVGKKPLSRLEIFSRGILGGLLHEK
jgi:hypothetical protein